MNIDNLDVLYDPYLVWGSFPQVYFTPEENEQISRYMPDIDTYVIKMEAEWMVKRGIDKQWDNYRIHAYNGDDTVFNLIVKMLCLRKLSL